MTFFLSPTSASWGRRVRGYLDLDLVLGRPVVDWRPAGAAKAARAQAHAAVVRSCFFITVLCSVARFAARENPRRQRCGRQGRT